MTTQFIEIQKKTGLSLQYKTYGVPKGGGETVLVLHALTGNSNVTGESGWWKEIVGFNKTIDLNRHHVIAIDIPGNGTNGQYINEVELYDTYLIASVIVQDLQRDGYDSIDLAFGVSLGGGLLWELIIDNANWIKKAFLIAAHYKSSAWLKGITHVQNEILNNSKNPIQDARKVAMFFYRSPEGFGEKFNNSNQAISWLDYHGKALKDRFSLKAYRLMNHLLGNINAIEGYLNFTDAIGNVSTEIIQVGIDSDILFPAIDNLKTHNTLLKLDKESSYHEIKSVHGHDAFLIEFEQLEIIIKQHINHK